MGPDPIVNTPTTPYNPNSHFPTAANTHQLVTRQDYIGGVQVIRITSRVAETTFAFTAFHASPPPSISGIGSSSASSKYIKPLNGNDTSETENFCL